MRRDQKCRCGGAGWDGCGSNQHLAVARVSMAPAENPASLGRVRGAVRDDSRVGHGLRGAVTRERVTVALARSGADVAGGLPRAGRLGLPSPVAVGSILEALRRQPLTSSQGVARG